MVVTCIKKEMKTPLLPTEIEALKKEKRTGKIFGGSVGLLIGIAAIAFVLTEKNPQWIAFIIIAIFGALIIGYFLSMWINRKVNMDLKLGQKEVKEEIITNKEQVDEPIANLSETGSFAENPAFIAAEIGSQKHYFLIGEDLIEVEKDVYQQVEIGEHVKVHMAPNSGLIFKVDLI